MHSQTAQAHYRSHKHIADCTGTRRQAEAHGRLHQHIAHCKLAHRGLHKHIGTAHTHCTGRLHRNTAQAHYTQAHDRVHRHTANCTGTPQTNGAHCRQHRPTAQPQRTHTPHKVRDTQRPKNGDSPVYQVWAETRDTVYVGYAALCDVMYCFIMFM